MGRARQVWQLLSIYFLTCFYNQSQKIGWASWQYRIPVSGIKLKSCFMCGTGLQTTTKLVYPMVDTWSKVLLRHRLVFGKIIVIEDLQRTATNIQAGPPTACVILLDLLSDFFWVYPHIILFVFFFLNFFQFFSQSYLSHLTCLLKSSSNKVHGFERIILACLAWGWQDSQFDVVHIFLRKLKTLDIKK